MCFCTIAHEWLCVFWVNVYLSLSCDYLRTPKGNYFSLSTNAQFVPDAGPFCPPLIMSLNGHDVIHSLSGAGDK